MLSISEKFFLSYIAGYTPPGLPGEGGLSGQAVGSHGLWLIPLATVLGGLLAGVLVYGLAPEAEGHGTDTAVRAFHRTRGFIRARVAPLKMLASAITIGSGGAAGREGPIALIGSGFGSFYANLTHRTEEERRLLVLIGMAAGLSAVFRSPIGTALFAIEVLYSDMEFDTGALLYTMLGSVVAYVINGFFVGWEPLFRTPSDVGIHNFTDYPWYILLGIVSGIVATILPNVFYRVRDGFRALQIPPHLKPALGGLGIGIIALFLPQVLGGGYGWIQQAIDGNLGIKLLIILVLAKTLAFSFTVSSGGSGGVFAPSLFIGAMVGGVLAKVLHQPPAPFVIVGMAAVFAGAGRVPVATLLMVAEMTEGYQLLVPASLAVMLSYLIQTTLSDRLKYRSLYEGQVASRAESPAHHVEYIQAAMQLLNERNIPLPSSTSHLNLFAILSSGIPVDLPDGKKLILGSINPESPLVNTPVKDSFTGELEDEIEIIAIMHGGRVLLPHPDTVLEAGSQLLVVATTKAKEWLEENLAPPSTMG